MGFVYWKNKQAARKIRKSAKTPSQGMANFLEGGQWGARGATEYPRGASGVGKVPDSWGVPSGCKKKIHDAARDAKKSSGAEVLPGEKLGVTRRKKHGVRHG